MIVKNKFPWKNDNQSHFTLQRLWNGFLRLLFCANILVIIAITIYVNNNRIASGEAWKKIDNKLQITQSIKTYPKAIAYALRGVFEKKENLTIDISHINMQKLEFMRINAIQGTRQFDDVPAIISQGNKQFKAKIKLKGDRKIHYENLSNASFRIYLKGDNTLYGMKTFSLHKPRSRNYIYEWIFLQLVKAEGLISPNYNFLNLRVNGKDLGLYALEEHYDKYLVERHGLKDGPIIRFDEDTSGEGKNRYVDMQVTPYNVNKWTSPELSSITAKAVNLLEGFKDGSLSVSEVFDTKKLAMFFAITDLIGTHHAAVPKSVRYYYNPITSRLEPIAFDGHNLLHIEKPIFAYQRGITPENYIYNIWPEWFHNLFNDPEKIDREFIREYIRALDKLSAPGYMEDYFSNIDADLQHNLWLNYAELPLEDKVYSFGPAPFIFDKNIILQKRNYAQKHINKVRLKAYLDKVNIDSIDVYIEVIDNKLPVEIIGLSCGDNVIPTPVNQSILVSQVDLNEPEAHLINFANDQSVINMEGFPSCLSLIYSRPGLKSKHTERVYPWKKQDDPTVIQNDIMRKKGNFELFDSILKRKLALLTIPAGRHIINENLIIPEGYTLEVLPGAEIVLNNNSIIFSRSPVRFLGDKNNPILVTTTDYTGQGIFILNAGQKSLLQYVKVNSLTFPDQNNWSLSGTFTFYESPVEIINSTFSGTRSEDALNIIRSDFQLSKLHFVNIKSDAIDIDFGSGNINNVNFENIGNDAIDVSGSMITAQKVDIKYAGDKGISAGEASMVNGEEINIDNTDIAIASKDNSTVNIKNLSVTNSKLALVSFQKKSEFGPGHLSIENYSSDGKGRTSLIESGSVLYLNGNRIDDKEINVEAKLYGKIYGKSSKSTL